VRRMYAAQVAAHTSMPASDLTRAVERGNVSEPVVFAAPARQATEGAGFIAIALLIHRWDDIAPWLIEELFAEESYRAAFRALVEENGDVGRALARVEGDAADILERASVVDFEADPLVEARALIAAAVRRELARHSSTDPDHIRADRQARITLDALGDVKRADAAAVELLQWLVAKTTPEP